MGKYIYESHLGGLYACNTRQDNDSLYCEDCGDYDNELGYAENVSKAWDILKPHTDTFDCNICDACEHKDDDEYCDNDCEHYARSGGYSLSYVMKFLHDEFKDGKWEKIYLIVSPKNHPEYILSRLETVDGVFGAQHHIPYCYCLKDENHNLIASSLAFITNGESSKPSLIKTDIIDNQVVHIYSCIEDVSDNPNWFESAHNSNNEWYGYIKKEDLKLTKIDKNIIS